MRLILRVSQLITRLTAGANITLCKAVYKGQQLEQLAQRIHTHPALAYSLHLLSHNASYDDHLATMTIQLRRPSYDDHLVTTT